MALSLRDLLDKQRAEREAKERVMSDVAKAPDGQTMYVSEAAMVPLPQSAPPVPTPPAPKRGMFSTLSGASSNVTQSQTPSSPSPPVPEAPVPRAAETTGTTNGAQSPAYSADETETLRKNLAFLAANLDEKEIIGQVLRTTVRQIQQHPELNAIMIDSDFDLIVQAARRSMKFTARKKEDKADAKATKQSKKAELDQWLKDQGISLD